MSITTIKGDDVLRPLFADMTRVLGPQMTNGMMAALTR
jgi:hypothetical protein